MEQRSLTLCKNEIPAKEGPILFSTPMVQAILEDRKGMTRRVMRQQPSQDENGYWHLLKNGHRFNLGGHVGKQRDGTSIHPYGIDDLVAKHAPHKPGDLLWVRETWGIGIRMASDSGIIYKADYVDRLAPLADGEKWRPSIFMPREAARLFLRVTGVRVERLQDITTADICSEGIWVAPPPIVINGVFFPNDFEKRTEVEKEDWYQSTARATYIGQCSHIDALHREWENIWDSINAKRGFGWDTNPWVWVVSFKKEEESYEFKERCSPDPYTGHQVR